MLRVLRVPWQAALCRIRRGTRQLYREPLVAIIKRLTTTTATRAHDNDNSQLGSVFKRTRHGALGLKNPCRGLRLSRPKTQQAHRRWPWLLGSAPASDPSSISFSNLTHGIHGTHFVCVAIPWPTISTRGPAPTQIISPLRTTAMKHNIAIYQFINLHHAHPDAAAAVPRYVRHSRYSRPPPLFSFPASNEPTKEEVVT